MKSEHFDAKREEFVLISITHFLRQFRETSRIEKSGIIRDHMIFPYINFIEKELRIFNKKDLLEKFKTDERSLRAIFQSPNQLKPSLSEKGYDAYFILKLIKENAKTHFHSFVILSYLRKRNINFRFNYLNIYKRLKTKDFQNYVKNMEEALSKFGTDFKPLKLDYEHLKFLATWWEYYQFSFIGEKIMRDIQGFLLDHLELDEIRKNIPDQELEILVQFLNNYFSSNEDYVEALRHDENIEQILLQLEEIGKTGKNLTVDSIFKYLLNKTQLQNFNDLASNPFFPSLDSFEMWVGKLIGILKIG